MLHGGGPNMDALGIDMVTPVGNSMGGATSMALAIDYAERVDKVVLMGLERGAQLLPLLPFFQ